MPTARGQEDPVVPERERRVALRTFESHAARDALRGAAERGILALQRVERARDEQWRHREAHVGALQQPPGGHEREVPLEQSDAALEHQIVEAPAPGGHGPALEVLQGQRAARAMRESAAARDQERGREFLRDPAAREPVVEPQHACLRACGAGEREQHLRARGGSARGRAGRMASEAVMQVEAARMGGTQRAEDILSVRHVGAG